MPIRARHFVPMLGLWALAACGESENASDQKSPDAATETPEPQNQADAGGAALPAADAGFALPVTDGGVAEEPSSLAGVSVPLTPEMIERIVDHTGLPEPPNDPTNAVYENPRAAKFGQFLYFDQRFSGTGKFSCATCHKPDQDFHDGLAFSQAAGTTGRHAPTIWNAAYNRWQFWDGRADSLWSQALKPMEHPAEQGGSRLQFAHLVHSDPKLRAAYEEIFGPFPGLSDTARFPPAGMPIPAAPQDPLAQAWASVSAGDKVIINRIFSNLGKAIAAYERLIITRRAPFDTFAEGVRDGDAEKQRAISPAAQLGASLFFGRGNCFLCHTGPNFSDREFHNLGLEPTDPENIDLGRYDGVNTVLLDPFNGMGEYSDAPKGPATEKIQFLIATTEQQGQFKTPSLRNAARTAPYMHGGHFSTLEEVLEFYSELPRKPDVGHREDFMVPLHFSPDEIAGLVAFIESLSGDPIAPDLAVQPASP